MAQTSLEHALRVVDQIGLTHMMAYDATGHTLEHHDGDDKGALAERIRECVANNSGLIRIDAWQSAPARQVGQRKADVPKVERVTWHIRGTLGIPSVGAPVAVPVAAAAAAPSQPVDVSAMIATAVAQATLQLKVEFLQAKVKEYEEAPEEDEPDEEPEPVGFDHSKPLFGMTGEQTFNLLSGLKDLIPGARPAATIGAAPQLSAQEAELWAAFKRFAAAQPDVAKQVMDDVLTHYGPNAKPEPDESK